MSMLTILREKGVGFIYPNTFLGITNLLAFVQLAVILLCLIAIVVKVLIPVGVLVLFDCCCGSNLHDSFSPLIGKDDRLRKFVHLFIFRVYALKSNLLACYK